MIRNSLPLAGFIRRAILTLCSAVVVVSGVSCQGEDAVGPTDAESPGGPALATSSTPLAFNQVSSGWEHTCGLTMEGQAYCWGRNVHGEVGDGTRTTRLVPVAVLGGLKFRQLSAGLAFTCALTTDYRAYCWGRNTERELGDRTTTDRQTPVAVRGGLRFLQVGAGPSHTCALTYPDRRAYCWGYNNGGQLGDGTRTTPLAPVPVMGSRQFRQVSAGNGHTCGVTPTYKAYCWGDNGWGQLGDDTRTSSLAPVPVFGGHQFKQLDAGGFYTCAVTTDARAFCWGYNPDGLLGTGLTFLRIRRPRLVTGGLQFSRVTAGEYHTCGETTLNRAYCWGENQSGQLGDGTSGQNRITPVPVTGGLLFSQVSAGVEHTCARTSTGVAYCWGWNGSGEIGDGTRYTHYDTPTPVAGPM